MADELNYYKDNVDITEQTNVFHRIGSTCPFCGNTVCIVEGMVYEYSMSKHGYPDNLLTEEYKVVGYCPSCHNPVYVLPDHGKYLVYPYPVIDEIEKYNAVLGKPTNQTRVSLLGQNYMTDIDNNPFTNVVNALADEMDQAIDDWSSKKDIINEFEEALKSEDVEIIHF